jgi:hypothetical protein
MTAQSVEHPTSQLKVEQVVLAAVVQVVQTTALPQVVLAAALAQVVQTTALPQVVLAAETARRVPLTVSRS